MNKSASRLSREEWLQRAMSILAREGESKLHIDSLCRKMKVTKGSFYWHFKNRDDFIRHLLDYYLRFTNRTVMDAVEEMSGDPRLCLLAILEIVQRKRLGRYEILMRSWAAHDSRVARVIREGERHRMKFAGGLFRKLGFKESELEDRTRIFVAYQRGENVAYVSEPARGRRERLKRRVDWLISR